MDRFEVITERNVMCCCRLRMMMEVEQVMKEWSCTLDSDLAQQKMHSVKKHVLVWMLEHLTYHSHARQDEIVEAQFREEVLQRAHTTKESCLNASTIQEASS